MRKHYEIDGVAALEREWRTFAASRHNQVKPLIVAASHQR